MKKRLILILLFCIVALSNNAFAYWGSIESEGTTINNFLLIGTWGNTVPDEWNLNILEDNNELNLYIPEGQIFSYDNLLYISISDNYNPEYNGLPGENRTRWALVALGLDWIENSNYRVNSVVRIYDEFRDEYRYFIANSNWNNNDWFIHNPLTHSGNEWSEWREISPIEETDFGWLDGYNLRDFAAPDWNKVIYI